MGNLRQSKDLASGKDALTPDAVGAESSAGREKPQAALGRHFGGGMTWMLVVTVISRFSSFITQTILGWLLSENDFALFAKSTAVAGLIMICRDAGMREFLVLHGKAGYERDSGPAFWLAGLYNFVVLGLIAAVAYPLAHWVYDDPRMVPMLLVMGASLPLATPGAIVHCQVRNELRFAAYNMQTGVSSLLRQVLTIIMAAMGMKAMAMALPLVLISIFDSLTWIAIAKDYPWSRPAQIKRWFPLLIEARWLIFGSIANFLMDFGSYLVIGVLLKDSIIGGFYFASQITAQIGIVLSENLRVLLSPTLNLLRPYPDRYRDAVLRTLRTLMLAGCLSCAGLAAVIRPLEHLLWQGKWSASVPAVIVLGAMFAWRVTWGLCAAVLLSDKKSKAFAVTCAIEALGLMLASGLGAWLSPSPVGLALWTGGWLLISRATLSAWTFHSIGIRRRDVLWALCPAWFISLVALGLTLSIESLWEPARYFENLLGGMGITRAIFGAWPLRLVDVMHFVCNGSLVTLLFLMGTRMLLASELRDACSVAPGRIGKLLKRLLLLG